MEEGIKHETVSVNGIRLHVAEKGEEGQPIVLLVHGFPELWYSWRHQIHALAAAGYRAVAPDMRGYGDSDAPPSPASYTIFHLVGDLLALIDLFTQDPMSTLEASLYPTGNHVETHNRLQELEFNQPKAEYPIKTSFMEVYIVGQDWGGIIAWYLCLFRPDKVKALVNLSVPFLPRFQTDKKPVQLIRESFGEDHYVSRFQEPGVMDANLASVGTKTLMKLIGIKSHPGLPILPKEGLAVPPGVELPIPSWLTEEDVDYFASKFDKTGYTGGLNYYRALDLSWELLGPWVGAKVTVPCKFVIGDTDLTYNTPGCKEYVHGDDGFKGDVTCLQEIVVMEDTGHFINQERPDDISSQIIGFFRNY